MDETVKAQIDFLKDSLKIMNDTNYRSLRKIAIDTIDRMEKQLLIQQRDSQQRELLKAFTEQCNRFRSTMEEITPEEIDKFMDSL